MNSPSKIRETGAIGDEQPVKGPFETNIHAGRQISANLSLSVLMLQSKHRLHGDLSFLINTPHLFTIAQPTTVGCVRVISSLCIKPFVT